MSNTNFEVKFAVGFILGMATGLAVALLLAPQSGGETGKLVKGKVASISERARNVAGGVAEDVGGMAREIAGDRQKIYKETWQQPKVKPYTAEL